MLMEKRFENFQQRYNQILKANQNQPTTHGKLNAFFFSKVAYLATHLIKNPEDEQKNIFTCN